MTWVMVALGLLGIGAAGSALVSISRPIGLAVGLAALIAASACCLVGGLSVLTHAEPATTVVEWPLPLGYAILAVDGLSAWFLILIGLTSLAAAVYSWGYFDGGRGPTAHRAYAPLVCIMVAAMVIVISAADVVMFLAGWEIMSVSAFFLVGLHDEDPKARYGAWIYLVATHIGTAVGVLPVLGAFVARSGGTHMSAFAGAFSTTEPWICIALFTLGVIGFGTKAGFVPFHVWLPVAHPVAPSPVSALMSGVVIKTGIYGLLRLLSWLPELPAACGVALGVLSIMTAITGILYALAQRQVKRMLAYSSVENIGIIGLGIAIAVLGRSMHQPVLVTLGLAGALLHTLNHALFKGLLFLSAGAVLHGTGTGDIERLGGVARRLPAVSIAFLAGSVAICALPPLNGFLSEYVIYMGLLQGLRAMPMVYSVFLAACAAMLALVGAVALAAFAKVFSVAFLGEPRDTSVTYHRVPGSMHAGMMFLMAACFGVVVLAGALPQPLSIAIDSLDFGSAAHVPAIHSPIINLTPVLLPLALFAVTIGLLLALRQRMPRGSVAGDTGRTWGCGYAFPTATMQYTGSSFAWKLLVSFRLLVRPTRRAPAIAGCFPGQYALDTDIPDVALDRMFRPGFRGLSRAFERMWPLQHGRVQLYLVYIVVTVLVVFLSEVWRAHLAPMPPGMASMVGETAVSSSGERSDAVP